MYIRRATADDLGQILKLFQDTIHHLNAKDYSQKQIAVWKQSKDQCIWKHKVDTQSFYVAAIRDKIVGFSSMDSEGYLDFMYVHHQFQKKGIAKSLLDTIEERAKEIGLKRVWLSASITAKPFFSKHCYVQYEVEHKTLSGVHFENMMMEKRIV